MLSQLYIKNIAVIKQATIDFKSGFNVFTGETGAGKTILINAINAVLGERTSKDIIRTGEQSAQISAVFDNVPAEIYDALADIGYALDSGESLLISRSISDDGKTQCKINGQPATVSILKNISGKLINVHGQHDSQQLLSPEKHICFIDDFGDLHGYIEEYYQSYKELKAIQKEIEEISLNEAEKVHKIDLLTYQIGEIENASLQENEEEELSAQRKVMRNSEKITLALAEAQAAINGDENEGVAGVEETVNLLSSNIEFAAKYLDGFDEMSDSINNFKYELQEYSIAIADALEGLEYNPEQAEYIEERLSIINNLKKKYGADFTEINSFLENAKDELERITFAEERLEALQIKVAKQLAITTKLAENLSEKRKASAKQFVSEVREQLSFLDMPSVYFTYLFENKPLSPNGIDSFELFISANVGEEPKPLSKIASGGEMSRIMLAIKNVGADRDSIGTLIFDEIDAGVSGRAAQKIGKKLAEAAKNKQVICVTHLAQVAAYANNHLLISKTVHDDKTFTEVHQLSQEEREVELARIIGGDIISTATLEAAREILEKSL